MALKLDIKPVRYQTIGCTTIMRYPVYSNGTYGDPKVIRSYNFTPRAEKTKKKPKPRPEFKVEEGGEM